MIIPPPIGESWQKWAEKVRRALQRLSILEAYTADASAAEDGALLWDRVNGYPVVSKGGAWRQIVLADGEGTFLLTSDVTAAAPDTAYSLTFDTESAHGVAKDGTNPERIVFAEGGHYLVSFTAQIDATSSSAVDFYFWPAINGTNAAGSTMKNTLKSSGSTLVVSRTVTLTVSAGDYLEAKWAVSDTNGQLTAFAATAFCPAAPSATLSIVRLHGE